MYKEGDMQALTPGKRVEGQGRLADALFPTTSSSSEVKASGMSSNASLKNSEIHENDPPSDEEEQRSRPFAQILPFRVRGACRQVEGARGDDCRAIGHQETLGRLSLCTQEGARQTKVDGEGREEGEKWGGKDGEGQR